MAGLYFLAAAPHTEAVSWVSGRTDLLVAFFSLSALWSYLRYRVAEARWPLVVAYVSLALALLSKESAVVIPIVALAIEAILANGRAPTSPSWRRRSVVLLGFFAVTAAYLLARHVLFDSPIGTYPNFRPTLFRIANNLRVSSVRSLVPGTPWTPDLFRLRLDVVAAGAAAILALRTRLFHRREVWAVAVALVASLAPVLPLEISLVDTQSERFVYLPSAFAAMLVAFAIDGLPERRGTRSLSVACLLALNLWALVVAERNWAQAGSVCTHVIDSLADRLRETALGPQRAILLLNFPDNFRGVYVLRNGFYQALRLRHPDVSAQAPRVIGVSSHGLRSLQDEVTVRIEDEGTLFVSVAPNRFLARPPSTPHYAIQDASDTAFRLRLAQGFEATRLLATRRARVVPVGRPGG